MKHEYEVLIIGGGPAGLSAALTLARIERSALVCDNNQPRNAPSAHINNLIGHDGIHPGKWRELAKQDLAKYPSIQFSQEAVINVQKVDGLFKAQMSNGREVLTKKIILAYGVQDRLLPLEGFKELWGKSIFHCPFCHGYEVRGQDLGIIVKSAMAFHPLPLIKSLAKSLILFTDGKEYFSPEQHSYLKKENISIINEPLKRLRHNGAALQSIELADGEHIKRDALFYAAEMPFILKSELGSQLGCKKSEFGLYEINDMGQTSVPGVYACGDNMQMAQSVLLACTSGVKAGFGAIAALLHDHA